MRLAPDRARAGITLTEILISILIMGVGMVSLATLFPLGLERIRQAQRNVRSVAMIRSAEADVAARNLFDPKQFGEGNIWVPFRTANARRSIDPWISDAFTNPPGPVPDPNYYSPIPVAFDPLWWAQVSENDTPINPLVVNTEGRFAADLTGAIRTDPDGSSPSAFGLQRLTATQFLPPGAALAGGGYTIDKPRAVEAAAQVFATLDDPVLQTEGEAATGTDRGSPIIPLLDPTTLSMFTDWTFTWMFTGLRTSTNTYEGDVVVFHNRSFALDPNPVQNGQLIPAGERLVEAVFAYGTTIEDPATNPDVGYSPQDRTVLLRWPITQPDPDVRIGSWIADVTYERRNDFSLSRFLVDPYTANRIPYPGQRCNWYRVAKVESAVVENTTMPPPINAGNFRRMVATLEAPVRARTLITRDTRSLLGQPVHINVALISPYVVHVFHRAFTAK